MAGLVMKRVAVLQSNYLPWKGYFDLIASVDEFIFYDDVQYTTRDWRNRNRIKTPQGVQWLTVPVGNRVHRPIRSVGITDPRCGEEHWKRLAANYARAPHFDSMARWLQPLFLERPWTMLSEVNRMLIEAICRHFGFATRLTDCASYELAGDRNERLVHLCRQAGATVYVSGPSAKDYLDVAAFEAEGMSVSWFDYSGYRPYPQLWGEFVHDVTVLDLLFNCGPEARSYLQRAGG